MTTARLRRTFASRIRKLREGKMNQGEFADSVGISRGAMSYYEQEARTPDIGVMKAICEKYKISSDYLLGLIPDRNHAISDVCKEIGLSPEAVKKLGLLNRLANTDFRSHEHMVDEFGENFFEAMNLTAHASLPQVLSTLLEHEEGLSLLTLVGAIIHGAEISQGEGEPPPTIMLKSASKNFEVAIPVDNLTAALWVNIQEDANALRDKLKEEPLQPE